MVAISQSDNRQGFLEPRLGAAMRSARIGVVGLSGGGSHIVQGLAHYGFQHYVLFDPKPVSEVHRHRLVGITDEDIRASRPKTEIMTRLIRGLQPSAEIEVHQADWRDQAPALRSCDVVFSCVDSFAGRDQLEAAARRYMIPLIDIGMSVKRLASGHHRVGGQVLLSEPGGPCMRCLGFLRDELLDKEASRYGDAGPQQQVIAANAQLAYAALDLLTDYFTEWAGEHRIPIYRKLCGNEGEIRSAHELRGSPLPCTHYPANLRGTPCSARC